MFKKYFSKFSNCIGIDLGTTNTLVSLAGEGIVINEPSIVAINNKTNKIVAIGTKAKEMIGRTPEHITTINPIIDGVISDYEITEEFLSYLINKANSANKKLFRPRVVVGVPVGVTDVEIRAVEDAARTAGAREVYIIEEPVAAAIGMGLPVHSPKGTMIVDIGGGTTDIVILSLSGIVNRKSLKVAGEKMNQDIINYIKDNYSILIGEKTVEEVKINMAGAIKDKEKALAEFPVKGRDITTGLPREVMVNEEDILEAITPSIFQIIETVREVLETTPPEVLGDILRDGIILTGGGSLIRNIDKLFFEQLQVIIKISENPLTDVARGAEAVLSDLDKHSDFLIRGADDEIQI